jgi:cell division protein FtsN
VTPKKQKDIPMSRDLKPRRRAEAISKRSAGGTLLGLFVGLVIGVLAAAAVVWYIHRTPPPFSARTQQPPRTVEPQGGVQRTPPGSSQAPLALPGKPGDPLPQNDKPRFDFYGILEGDGDAIPGASRPAPGPNEARPTEANKPQDAKDALKEAVFLQTGSFLSAGDADNQKAMLAMMGIEAAVQQVMLQDKVWYRVRLGPFRRIEEVNALRAELARQGVGANIVKKD